MSCSAVPSGNVSEGESLRCSSVNAVPLELQEVKPTRSKSANCPLRGRRTRTAVKKVMSTTFFTETRTTTLGTFPTHTTTVSFFPQHRTQMALYTKVQKLMDATVEEFCRRLVEKHDGLDVKEMMGLWKETAKRPKGPKKPKRRTAYMSFSQVTRTELKAQHPDMAFGAISSEISRRWKAMTPEDKEKYTPVAATASPLNSPASSTGPTSVPATPASPTKTKALTSPKKATVPELKKLCKQKGLSVKGLKKREEFEELLASLTEQEDEDGILG